MSCILCCTRSVANNGPGCDLCDRDHEKKHENWARNEMTPQVEKKEDGE